MGLSLKAEQTGAPTTCSGRQGEHPEKFLPAHQGLDLSQAIALGLTLASLDSSDSGGPRTSRLCRCLTSLSLSPMVPPADLPPSQPTARLLGGGLWGGSQVAHSLSISPEASQRSSSPPGCLKGLSLLPWVNFSPLSPLEQLESGSQADASSVSPETQLSTGGVLPGCCLLSSGAG